MEGTRELRRFEVRDTKTGRTFIISEIQRIIMRRTFDEKVVTLPGLTWFEFSDGSGVLKRIDESTFQVTDRSDDSPAKIGQLMSMARESS